MNRLMLLLLFFINTLSLFSQNNYFIKERSSGDPIPFVKIYPDSGLSFLADIDGIFQLPHSIKFIRLHQTGYADTTIELIQVKDFIILMNNQTHNLPEIEVKVIENPAHRIIRQAIQNRKKNNPMENDVFRYNSYSKFFFDIDRDKLASIPDTTTDTTMIKLRDYFSNKHLFILENASKRTFIPPSRDKEEIIAYKVSGFNDPMFATFANSMQSFSFYENQFQLLGKTYINPIALGGLNRYLFVLEDTTINQSDTTFTIFYRPRKGKNFEGMTGRLYINTNGFAIEKVTASPFDRNNGASVEIVQEYLHEPNKKWFPAKLSTTILFGPTISIEGFEVHGKGSTYITDVEINPQDINKKDFNNVIVTTLEGSEKVDESSWDTLRVHEITNQERLTYHIVDSISKAERLDKKLRVLKILSTGKIPLGYLALDLNRLLNYDKYEGYRFGLGLETSDKISRRFLLGTYGAWGSLDKAFKYGAYSTVFLTKQKQFKCDLRYQQDVIERGGILFQKDASTFDMTALYRHFFIQNMETQRLAEVAFSGIFRSNFKISFIGNYQRVWFMKQYLFWDTPTTSINQCDLFETAIEVNWNIRQKVIQLGDMRIPKETNKPLFRLKISKGDKKSFNAQFDYWRLFFDVHHNISIRGVGKFDWNLNASQTIGKVPLFLLQVPTASGIKWNVSAPNSFETVAPSEFYHDKQTALFTRLLFNPIKTKVKWNQPQFGIHHAVGYGEMSNREKHSIAFKSMDKGLFEVGLLLNNLFVSKSSGIGIGLFYRYGYYSSSNAKNNLMPKISVSLLF